MEKQEGKKFIRILESLRDREMLSPLKIERKDGANVYIALVCVKNARVESSSIWVLFLPIDLGKSARVETSTNQQRPEAIQFCCHYYEGCLGR